MWIFLRLMAHYMFHICIELNRNCHNYIRSCHSQLTPETLFKAQQKSCDLSCLESLPELTPKQELYLLEHSYIAESVVSHQPCSEVKNCCIRKENHSLRECISQPNEVSFPPVCAGTDYHKNT